MTVWFTSDLHFGHANVINYCRRPFAHVDEMNEALISNWNARVAPEDTVYVLGDFALAAWAKAAAFASRLKGVKTLVAGNHDRDNLKHYRRETPFAQVVDLLITEVNGKSVTMCHYPMISWAKSHYGAWMLHGHCHGSLKDDPHALRIDVGVDCHDFAPVSFEEVAEKMSRKLWKPVDHHGAG